MYSVFTRRISQRACIRTVTSMSRTLPSAAYTDPGRTQEASTSGTSQDITKLQKDTLDAALRVDQAGEVAANYIYMGQLAVLGRDRTVGPLIQVSNSTEAYLTDRQQQSHMGR